MTIYYPHTENVLVSAISENQRVLVTYDQFDQHECPASWGDPADQGMLPIRWPRNHVEPERLTFGDDAENARDAMEAWEEHMPYHEYHRPEPSDAAVKHLRRKGFTVGVYTLYGGSQSDWLDIILWSRHGSEGLEALRKRVQQWMRGDIYTVTFESREIWEEVRVEPGPSEPVRFERWVQEDSVSGVYFDDVNDLREIAEFADDNFGVQIAKPEARA